LRHSVFYGYAKPLQYRVFVSPLLTHCPSGGVAALETFRIPYNKFPSVPATLFTSGRDCCVRGQSSGLIAAPLNACRLRFKLTAQKLRKLVVISHHIEQIDGFTTFQISATASETRFAAGSTNQGKRVLPSFTDPSALTHQASRCQR